MKMSLIDHFNAFHVVSQELGLTPNARSLYFAILGEFNKMQYPPFIKLQNTYLQHLSGINSTCSFRSARNALINAGLISHKNQFYSLENLQKDSGNSLESVSKESRNTLETFQKDSRNSLESVSKESRNTLETFQKDFRKVVESPFNTTTMSKNKEKEKEKEREKEETTTTEKTRAREVLSTNSDAVKQAWFLSEGEPLKGGYALDMIQLENQYGTEALVNAITAARRSNTEKRLTYVYLKAILENRKKGGKANGTKFVADAESWEQQTPDWLH